MTNEDFGRMEKGQQVKVYVYEHIREQSHDLFGFTQIDTKEII